MMIGRVKSLLLTKILNVLTLNSLPSTTGFSSVRCVRYNFNYFYHIFLFLWRQGNIKYLWFGVCNERLLAYEIQVFFTFYFFMSLGMDEYTSTHRERR